MGLLEILREEQTDLNVSIWKYIRRGYKKNVDDTEFGGTIRLMRTTKHPTQPTKAFGS